MVGDIKVDVQRDNATNTVSGFTATGRDVKLITFPAIVFQIVYRAEKNHRKEDFFVILKLSGDASCTSILRLLSRDWMP